MRWNIFTGTRPTKEKSSGENVFRNRKILVLFVFISCLAFLTVKLFLFQVGEHKRFLKLAMEQHNKNFRIDPRRGAIFDRYMEPLAINLDAWSVFCDPRILEKKERTAEELSDISGVNENDLVGRIERGKAFVWVKRKISDEEAEKIRALKIKGVYLIRESKRYYPNDNMASHILGFVNVDNKGLEGLELRYNKELAGIPGWKDILRDAKKRPVLIKENQSVPAQNGCNLILTMDSVIQYIVEREIKKMAEKFNVSKASIIVMEPSTGKILALANYPDYNLNEYSTTSNKLFKDISIADVYEPGSVFKMITASAALDEGSSSPEDKFFCENGEYRVGGRILHDYHGYGELTFTDVIAKSSNIGTVKIAQKLGGEEEYDYMCDFGIGKLTGVDLPGEVPGLSRPYSRWSRSDITTIPIGQGVAVTALQMACAASVIANGGYLMKPYVVSKITTPQGEIYKQFKPVIRRKVLKAGTCDTMKYILNCVVNNGTGRNAKSKKYEFCGKTGTAQMVNPAGGYYKHKYIASFVGFAPMDDPRITIAVTAFDPHPIHFGGSVAAHVFKNIAEKVLDYLGTDKGRGNNAEKTHNVPERKIR